MEGKKNVAPQPLEDPDARDFFTYLAVEKDDSPLTLVNYRDDLCRFREFLAKRLPKVEWGNVTILDIRAYLAQMHDEGLSRRTIARRVSALRSFYRFLRREGRVASNPFLKVRTPKLEKSSLYFWKSSKSTCCCGSRTPPPCWGGGTGRFWNSSILQGAVFRNWWDSH